MNSKSVILLGLLAALLLIFFCIFFNAERYYDELGLSLESKSILASKADMAEHNENQKLIQNATVNNDMSTSSFDYSVKDSKTFISGKMPLLDNGDRFKKFIADCSKDKLCKNNVIFFDYDEAVPWKNFASSTLTLFMNEKIINPKLSIHKNSIKIEGVFTKQSGKNKLLSLIKKHKSLFSISDRTMVNKELNAKDSSESLKQEQEEISKLLKNTKINFKRNSGKIRKEGKKVLDAVAKLLKGKKNILIDIQGYTDAGGKQKTNLWISQARADGVKKYLIKKGIKANIITAKGYGEKKLLLPKAPYDPSNRRVEIHLKRR